LIVLKITLFSGIDSRITGWGHFTQLLMQSTFLIVIITNIMYT